MSLQAIKAKRHTHASVNRYGALKKKEDSPMRNQAQYSLNQINTPRSQLFTRDGYGGEKNTKLPSINRTIGASVEQDAKMKESYNSFIYKPELLLEKVNRLEGRATTRKAGGHKSLDPYQNIVTVEQKPKQKTARLSEVL